MNMIQSNKQHTDYP